MSRYLRALPLVAGFALIVAFGAVVSAGARAKPTCFGQTATIVGTSHGDRLHGTARKDVIVALGGNDVVKTKDVKANQGRDVICGGGGSDRIAGNSDPEKISGGPGNDVITAGNGDDIAVGDNANPFGGETGATGKDDIGGAGGADFMVGDNYGSGNVTGASPDKDFRAGGAGDTVIGDDASVGGGTASGGADDVRMGGANGNDLVIGDSYAKNGNAMGGGADVNNSGPGNDLAVGDSYTVNGDIASGSGRDDLHAADGGDTGATCRPASSCADVFYGDSYRAACAANQSVAANVPLAVIRCEANHTRGGAPDLLNSDQGDDFMNGGNPDPDPGAGSGDTVDRCDGGSGSDFVTRCKVINDNTFRVIPFP